jgi:hypothetical protein
MVNGMGKPLALVQIDDMARHVQNTLRRCPDPVGESLVKMLGGLLMHCLRKHLGGHPAHPGLAKMAGMGRCSERQAQRNLRQLEAWEVMFPVADVKGGRRATRYFVNLVALKRALVATRCNPSEELFEKIDAVAQRVRGDIRGDIKGDVRGDAMSPGIHTEMLPTQAKGFRVIGGGRDA